MKTRTRIFCPYFEWNESIHLENREQIGRGKFSSVYKCHVKAHASGRDELDRTKARVTNDDQEEVAVKILDKSTIISQSMTKQVFNFFVASNS